MSGALHSSQWFRVAGLRPRLKGHVRVHRQVFRGEVWYTVEDRMAGKFHRFNRAAYMVLQGFDGKQTLQQLWDALMREVHDHSPSQDDIVQLLGQLYSADLVNFDVTPDVAELFSRRGRQERQKWTSRLLNPMSLRFPLWDPNAFLSRLVGWLKPLQGKPIWALWLAVVLPALLTLPPHWGELTQNFSDQLLSIDNLWVMALAFPLLKGVHELAHGWAVRARGGEVHEMGLMLLMFYPVPYVDASSAHAFDSKRARIQVSLAGMAAEAFVAALAFYLWTMLEPGLVRSVAYNIIVIGSVTTVLFNANPLMRYDGYFALQDAIEVPNLGQRANQYWQHLVTRHVFGALQSKPPIATAGERRWFAFYAPAAFVYRLTVTVGIAWMIAQKYFFVGVLLALWSLLTGLVMPVYKGLHAVFFKPPYTSRRGQVVAVLSGSALAAVLALFVVPMPHHSHAQGVLALPDKAMLRAGTDGFVMQVLQPSGAPVQAGHAVLTTFEPSLQAKVQEQEAKLEEAQARQDAAWGAMNPAEAGRQAEAVKREEAALARLSDEAAQLTVRAQSAGQLLIEHTVDLPGRFVRKGEVLGYVVGRDVPIVKVAVSQDQVEPVSHQARDVEVRLPQATDQVWHAQLVRAVPKASHELPSAALGTSGGGPFAVDPQDDKHVHALDNVFEFEVRMPAAFTQQGSVLLGSRAYVRFEHPAEPIAWRWMRQLRRQFLSHLQW